MSGGWIKMGVGLRRHPKVVRIASALKADKLRVIGGLHAVWCVFDEHSADGFLDGYTLSAMDEEVGWDGFSAAMAAIGWLVETDSGLLAPDYDEHNGPSAKRRAQETERKRTARASMSASDADKLRSREEKRREEIEPKGSSSSDEPTTADGAVAGLPCPYDRIVGLYHERLPDLPRVKLMPKTRQRALRKLWGWVLSSKKSDGSRRATSADEAMAWLASYFARAAENDFLMGRTPRSGEHANWRCDLDFLLTDKGMRHVIEKTQEAA